MSVSLTSTIIITTTIIITFITATITDHLFRPESNLALPAREAGSDSCAGWVRDFGFR